MYCIKCGTQNPVATRYCNRCGTNLEELREVATHGLTPLQPHLQPLVGPKHVWLVLVLSAILGIAGLGTVVGLLTALVHSPLADHDSLMPVLVLLGLGGVAGTAFMVSRLLRLVSTAVPALDPPQTGAAPKRISAPPELSLPEANRMEGVPSVVEHTTARLPDYAPPHHEEPPRR
jgi:hypothetical protein